LVLVLIISINIIYGIDLSINNSNIINIIY